MSEPIHVDDNAFEKTVLQSSVPVLVDFWAPWCGPCRMVAPSLDKIAQEYGDRLLVAKVNTDQSPVSASRFRITGIPTLLFIAGGQVKHQQVGALSYNALKESVDQFLAEVAPSRQAAN
jgi:thioredoxin 1